MNKTSTPTPPASDYDEQRIPFEQVMRKLANTKPPHKTPKPAPSKPPTTHKP